MANLWDVTDKDIDRFSQAVLARWLGGGLHLHEGELLLLSDHQPGQLGAALAQRISAVRLRLVLALIVLAVGLRMLLGLTWHPGEIFTVTGL